MFVKEKKKYVQYESLSKVYDKSIEIVHRISHIIKICLRKSEIGLGFTLGSEETENKDENYIFVRKILDFSPAKCDGRLQVGDRILKINNLDVATMSQADIVRLIRSLPIGEIITITISRICPEDEDADPAISISQTHNYPIKPHLSHTNDNKMGIFHFIITITTDVGKISHCQGSAGVLGMSVECRATEIYDAPSPTQDSDLCNQVLVKKPRNIQRQFFVKTILKKGSASQDSRLRIGDEILAIQGIDVQNGKTYIVDPNFDIYGDIFHFDLAAVFLKNLEKVNKLSEFRQMFEISSENTLHALKSLIKEAGNMYSSISIVVRRMVLSERKLPDDDLILKTYKNSKKKINELCRIENIFELNPDYRHNYGDRTTRVERFEEDEESDNIHGRYHPERFMRNRNSDYFENGSMDARNTDQIYIDDCGHRKAVVGSSQVGSEDFYSYFGKGEPFTEMVKDSNNNDNNENEEDLSCDFLEESNKGMINLCLNIE